MFFAAAILVVPIFGLWDVARLPGNAFADVGRRKSAWIAIQILVPVFGTLAYYAFVRPGVRASARWPED